MRPHAARTGPAPSCESVSGWLAPLPGMHKGGEATEPREDRHGPGRGTCTGQPPGAPQRHRGPSAPPRPARTASRARAQEARPGPLGKLSPAPLRSPALTWTTSLSAWTAPGTRVPARPASPGPGLEPSAAVARSPARTHMQVQRGGPVGPRRAGTPPRSRRHRSSCAPGTLSLQRHVRDGRRRRASPREPLPKKDGGQPEPARTATVRRPAPPGTPARASAAPAPRRGQAGSSGVARSDHGPGGTPGGPHTLPTPGPPPPAGHRSRPAFSPARARPAGRSARPPSRPRARHRPARPRPALSDSVARQSPLRTRMRTAGGRGLARRPDGTTGRARGCAGGTTRPSHGAGPAAPGSAARGAAALTK